MTKGLANRLATCQLVGMSKTAKHPLATWREAQNLTQEAFAKRIVSTRWTINSIETGRRRAGRDLAATIIKATDGGVSFEDLMAWEPEADESPPVDQSVMAVAS